LLRRRTCLQIAADSFTVPSLQQTAQLYRVEDWVAVRSKDDWCIGIITALNMEEVEVNCMRRVDKSQNQFTWPRVRDCTWYVKSNILCSIPPPTPITRRRTAFVLSKENQAKIMSIWKNCWLYWWKYIYSDLGSMISYEICLSFTPVTFPIYARYQRIKVLLMCCKHSLKKECINSLLILGQYAVWKFISFALGLAEKFRFKNKQASMCVHFHLRPLPPDFLA
jgi:hypothetical protein